MTSGKQAKSDRAARQAKIDAAAPKERKTKPALVAAVVLVTLLALGAAVWFGNRSTAPDPAGTATGNSADHPQGATGPEGGIAISSANLKEGAPTLDVYEDFQCPACQQIEQALGPTIKKMANDGEIKVVYHTKTFLDANLRNDASTRAGNGAACAADAGAFGAYHDQVYANPPANEGEGWTDAQLEQFASAAGISGDKMTTWQQCFADRKYTPYLQRVEEATARAGVTSTPSFRVNGEKFDLQQQQIASAEDFRTKVLAAGGQ